MTPAVKRDVISQLPKEMRYVHKAVRPESLGLGCGCEYVEIWFWVGEGEGMGVSASVSM